MNLCELPDYTSQCSELSRARFATNSHASLLAVAASAADRKADAFSNAGDERRAHLHRELGYTRRRVIEILQSQLCPATHAR